MDLKYVEQLLRPLQRVIAQIVVVGTITNSDDSGAVQKLQATVDDPEPTDDIGHMMPWGFASRPIEGARGLFLAIKGWRWRTVCVGIVDGRYRLKNLQRGESALYDDQGNYVWIERGQVHVKGVAKVFVEAPEIEATATASATVTAPVINLNGAVTITGSLEVNGVPVP